MRWLRLHFGDIKAGAVTRGSNRTSRRSCVTTLLYAYELVATAERPGLSSRTATAGSTMRP